GLHTPGSGLGLAIVQEAARQLGGNVQLGPGLEGRGAGFVLTLPAAPI
ncbi:MAG: ATP-binding protein, partial [Zoogloea sp.]